jgi:hypothetical protein
VRLAASKDGYRLVINARVDVVLGPFFAGADCVYPIDCTDR